MGIETAIIGSAILGAAGSAIGGSKASSAAKSATQAQTQAANQQLALNRDIYYDQRGLQQPFYQAGLQGLYGPNGVMDLMGFSQPQAQPAASQPSQPGMVSVGGGAYMPGGSSQPMVQAGPQNAFASGSYGAAPIGQPAPTSGPDYGAYLQANPDVAAYYRSNPNALAQFGGDINKAAQYHYETFGRAEGRQLPQFAPQTQTAQPAQTQQPSQPATPAQPGAPAAAPVDPRTQSLRSTPGYQFQMDEARRGVENSFASRGKLLSGSALTALQDRSQGLADNTYQTALSNAFALTNLGTGGASQIQNAGTNYANAAGNAFANIGNANANGAINRANAWNAGFQGVADSIAGGIGAYGAYRNWAGNGSGTTPTGTFNGIGWGGTR